MYLAFRRSFFVFTVAYTAAAFPTHVRQTAAPAWEYSQDCCSCSVVAPSLYVDSLGWAIKTRTEICSQHKRIQILDHRWRWLGVTRIARFKLNLCSSEVGFCTAAGRLGSISAPFVVPACDPLACLLVPGAPLVFELSKSMTGRFDFFIGILVAVALWCWHLLVYLGAWYPPKDASLPCWHLWQ